MTRIDPLSKTMVAPDGRVFSFSKNQVRWILGIPCGSKAVPNSKLMTGEVRAKVQQLVLKYGTSWKTKSSRGCGSVYTSVGIPVSSEMMGRLEAEFGDDEEEEFKSIFLIVSLHMVLCPTQSPRLGTDLLPALSCVMNCVEYDWCDLVLKKLMDSVSSFARRFYANGFAGGCGGCAILPLNPVQWDMFPRVKVWSMKQIRMASKDDRRNSGDFGKLGTLPMEKDTLGRQGMQKHPMAILWCEGCSKNDHGGTFEGEKTQTWSIKEAEMLGYGTVNSNFGEGKNYEYRNCCIIYISICILVPYVRKGFQSTKFMSQGCTATIVHVESYLRLEIILVQ